MSTLDLRIALRLVRFTLTLALSQRERELPPPLGEGWGEGKQISDNRVSPIHCAR
jgi:hypothetical protein